MPSEASHSNAHTDAPMSFPTTPAVTVPVPAKPNQPGSDLPNTMESDERPVILRLEDVGKTYDIGTPRETEALRGINLEITLAEIVVIFGPSGSG